MKRIEHFNVYAERAKEKGWSATFSGHCDAFNIIYSNDPLHTCDLSSFADLVNVINNELIPKYKIKERVQVRKSEDPHVYIPAQICACWFLETNVSARFVYEVKFDKELEWSNAQVLEQNITSLTDTLFGTCTNKS